VNEDDEVWNVTVWGTLRKVSVDTSDTEWMSLGTNQQGQTLVRIYKI